MLLEPPGPQLPAGRAPGVRALTAVSGNDLRLAAAVAATVLAGAATGDVFVLAAVLGFVSADRVAAGALLLAGGAVVARWGTGALAAVAGGQAVLGPAAGVSPPLGGAATAIAALAFLLAVPSVRAGAAGLALVTPFGAAAALVAAGPAAVTLVDAGIRFGATVAAVALSFAAARWLPARSRHIVALTAAAAALVLAMVA